MPENTTLIPARFVAEDRRKELYLTADSNALLVNTFYQKGRGVVLSVAPAVKMPDGVFSTQLMSGKFLMVEPMPRDNKKKVAAHHERAVKAIEEKSGEAYLLAQQVLQQYGMELVEETAAVV